MNHRGYISKDNRKQLIIIMIGIKKPNWIN